MPKRKALDLIQALAQDEANLQGQEFLAPLRREGRARLRLRGLIHELRVANPQPGWWICRIKDTNNAEIVDETLPWQRGDYLALWPHVRLVLLEAIQGHVWLALPYNPAEALQRFNITDFVTIQLVEGGQPFERVIGRVEGDTIWYDDHDRRADLATAEGLRQALAEQRDTPGIAGLGAGEQMAYTLLNFQTSEVRPPGEASSTDQRIRHALEVGGAQLLGYEVTDHGIRVTWERNGQRSITLVGDDLGVYSAGICLSGEDTRFDLTSIVGVVNNAPSYARDDYDDF
ncbi:MAG: hypothetical protein GFH27_549333n63 [Chloroflexi bacterium AL-W]|nr:hypothetical protein [Chloroflexi bacterium AL-N1]NOK70484.1 hypothetical protein [Chloroflexi bacterium AL-N10]NOK78157.1 hypothetical protein [Chloroflexi bacterium AL-N5]NOK85256.1 hypothetical protein [Chloroflexi bacterium AL-W]NOK92021.1 hypothetical protein [Chloroflexi bacterium AL-N15]